MDKRIKIRDTEEMQRCVTGCDDVNEREQRKEAREVVAVIVSAFLVLLACYGLAIASKWILIKLGCYNNASCAITTIVLYISLAAIGVVVGLRKAR